MTNKQDSDWERVLEHLSHVAPELGNELKDSGETDLNETDTAEKVSSGDVPTIVDFRIIRRIGAGGFGTVWLARNRHDRKLYALKTISLGREFELEGVREYQKRSKHHPNLVAISHVGQTNGIYYYVMPLADNAIPSQSVQDLESYEPLTLESHIDRRGGLSVVQILNLVEQILSGLQLIHERGGVHRDVKPANILRIDGRWQLGDPGLMTGVNSKSPSAGTPAFTSPEARSGYRTDLYALGVTVEHSVEPTEFVSHAAKAQALKRIVERAKTDQRDKQYRSTKEMHRDIVRARNKSLRPPLILFAIVAVLVGVFYFTRSDSLDDLTVVRTHISVDTQDGMAVGVLGETLDAASVDQTIHLSLDLNQSAYLCAIAFDTNGQTNLVSEGAWDDSKESRFSFPRSQNSGSAFYALTDGSGVQAVAVFAADSPPAPNRWRHKLDQVAWSKSDWADPVFWFARAILFDILM